MAMSKQPWSALRLFDELMHGEGFFYPFAGFQASVGTVRAPHVDIDVRDKDYIVSVELPGVKEVRSARGSFRLRLSLALICPFSPKSLMRYLA